MRITILVLCSIVLVGCGGDAAEHAQAQPPRDPLPQEEPAPAASADDQRFHAALLAAAKEYGDYGNLDDQMRWAPALCRVPPAQIRESASTDGDTHGRKLYWLHAKDRTAYLAATKGKSQPVGQVLVKEAFVPVEGEGEVRRIGHRAVYTTVRRDGKSFHAGERQAFYILLKLDPATEGTDQGWVYGTVTPDGKTVTSAGRVASCMGCHTENTTDRMFGLPH